jgi:hypothetical protein
MRLLLATNHLYGWTGSEITLATLCKLLREAGHEVLVYATFVGGRPIAEALLEGNPWTTELQAVKAFAPVAAYTQHHPVALQVRAALPEVPIAHALLGVLPYLEQAPRLDLGLSLLLPISEEVAQSAALTLGDHVPTRLFRNLVDDELFSVDTLDDRPRRRLGLVSYKLDRPRLDLLAQAASRHGLELIDHQPARPGSDAYAGMPERVRSCDIVVCSGRGAIEAMLCGRVPLIMANCGDDGLVTAANFERLMSFNFSGRASGHELDAAGLDRALALYTPGLHRQLLPLARQHLGLSTRRAEVLSIFEALANSTAPALDPVHLDRLRFFSEGLAQQRQFAQRTDLQRREPLLDPAQASVEQLLQAGHDAWRLGDTELAFEAYLKAFKTLPHTAAAARSLVSNLLVQLASREKRAANPAGQRAALQAFLSLSPDNAWATQQLATLASEQPRQTEPAPPR